MPNEIEKIIECVPNFSEGKNQRVIDTILRSISKVDGIKVLDVNCDKDHNRAVITFIGCPKNVINAAFACTKMAAKLIDLNKHKGVHPRIGATDVIPLVPIKNVTYKECVKYAKILGKRIGVELEIPVYLYEKAAKISDRKNLANIRNIGYGVLRGEIKKNIWRKPDFGPLKLGKAGAVSIGVRKFLIAFNVNLKSKDLEIAKKIANSIREKKGGLKNVKALGLMLKNRGFVQVSMNLTDYKKTSPLKAFKFIEKEAKKYKVQILESELIGLASKEAMPKDARKVLRIRELKSHQIVDFKNCGSCRGE